MRPAGHTNLQSLEARLLESLASDLSVTLLTVVSGNGKALATEQLGKLQQVFHQAEVNRRVVESNDPAEVILNELSKDYDLLVLGASERNSDKVVFNPIVDYLVRVAPCPTLVVKGNVNGAVWPPRTILVPTTGGREGRYAAETAFALAQGEGARVVLLNVLTQRPAPYRYGTDDHDRQVGAAYDMLQEFRKLGEANEVLVDTEVRFGPDPESMILTFAKQQSADLIVLGTDVRAGSNRLYLGPRVERLLEGADCPVVVVNGG